MVLIRLRYW